MQNLTEYEKQQLQTLKGLMAQTTVLPSEFMKDVAGQVDSTQLLREYHSRFESI